MISKEKIIKCAVCPKIFSPYRTEKFCCNKCRIEFGRRRRAAANASYRKKASMDAKPKKQYIKCREALDSGFY